MNPRILWITAGVSALAGVVLAVLGVGVPCPPDGPPAKVAEGRYVVEKVSDGADMHLYGAEVVVKGDEVIVTQHFEDGASVRYRYAVEQRAIVTLGGE